MNYNNESYAYPFRISSCRDVTFDKIYLSTANKVSTAFLVEGTSSNIKLMNSNFRDVSANLLIDDQSQALKVKNVEGYPTEASGIATFSGDGSTTDFLIGDHGLVVTDPTKIIVKVTPISADAIAASPCIGYVDPNDNTKIRVKFASAPASGTDNVQIAWEAQVV